MSMRFTPSRKGKYPYLFAIDFADTVEKKAKKNWKDDLLSEKEKKGLIELADQVKNDRAKERKFNDMKFPEFMDVVIWKYGHTGSKKTILNENGEKCWQGY